MVKALTTSKWKVEFTVLPVGAMGTSVDFLNKEARDKLGITWKSYEAFRKTVAAHSIAALHEMWTCRGKEMPKNDAEHRQPPPG